MITVDDKPVYYDPEKHRFYWVEWDETGNNDIPIRHYLDVVVREYRVVI